MNREKFMRCGKLWGCWIICISIILIFTVPIYYIFTLALKSQLDAFAYPPKWLFTPSFENFKKLFVEEQFARYLLNSLITSAMCVVLGLLVSAPAAYALSRLKTKWSGLILFCILAVRMIPPMSLLLPTFNLYVKLNLMDTYAGVVLLYLTFVIPLDVWMLKTFFDEVPKALEEAAWLDGCSTFQTFIRVALPMTTEALTATAIYSWILSWNEFLFSMVVTRNAAKTAPVAINNFMKFEDMQWGLIAAAAVIISFPVLIFGVAVRKYLVSGLTSGAVKE